MDDNPFCRLDWTSRNRSVKRLFLEHALMVSDIMVSLEITCRQRGDVRLLIEHKIPLPAVTRNQRAPFQWTVTGSGKEKLGVIPDRVFALEFTDSRERILCFLEADRGTMPVERATHRSRFGMSRVRVLTVTTIENRCKKICEAASVVSGGRGILLQSCLTSNFSSETCLGPVWRSATNARVRILD